MTSSWRSSLRGFFSSSSGSVDVSSSESRRSSLRPGLSGMSSDIEDSQDIRIVSMCSNPEEEDVSMLEGGKKALIRRHSHHVVSSFVQRSVEHIEKGTFGKHRPSIRGEALVRLSLESTKANTIDPPQSPSCPSHETGISRQVSGISTRFTTSEESSSDEDEENIYDTDEDGADSIGRGSQSIHTSTLTLTLDNQSDFVDENSSAGRIAKAFEEDLDWIVDLAVSLPEGTRKLHFLQELIRSLRALKTDVTLNSHFIVLSSLVCQPILELDEDSQLISSDNP